MDGLGRAALAEPVHQSIAEVGELADGQIPPIGVAEEVLAEARGNCRVTVLAMLRGAIKRMEKRPRSRPDPNPAF